MKGIGVESSERVEVRTSKMTSYLGLSLLKYLIKKTYSFFHSNTLQLLILFTNWFSLTTCTERPTDKTVFFWTFGKCHIRQV